MCANVCILLFVFFLHFFLFLLIKLLLLSSVCLSTVHSSYRSPLKHQQSYSFSTLSDSESKLSVFKRSLADNGGDAITVQQHEPYMKSSQFFNRYFACQYELKLNEHHKQHNNVNIKNQDISIDPSEDDENSMNLKNGENVITYPNDDRSQQIWQQQKSFPLEVKRVNITTWRHSKRQSRIHKKSKLFCSVECDGVTRWPETAAASVQQISCLDVLESFRQMPSATVMNTIVDDDNLVTISNSNPELERIQNSGIKTSGTTTPTVKSDLISESVFIESHMHSGKCFFFCIFSLIY